LAHILNPLLSIKVPLKVAYKPSDWLQAAFRSTFIDKRGFRIWAIKYKKSIENNKDHTYDSCIIYLTTVIKYSIFKNISTLIPDMMSCLKKMHEVVDINISLHRT